MFDIKFSSQSQKELAKLPKNLQVRIINKLHFFSNQNNPLLFSKPLVNLPPSTHRFRVVDYRIAFYIKEKNIIISHIGHRKEVYLR